jgi:hypothetical protein
MKAAQRGNPASRFDRFAFWLGLGITAWVASVLLTQGFYWLVPAKPSPAVLSLQDEASRKPRLTENGFRLAGLRAPAGWDPVAFGRCLYPDAEKLEAMSFRDPEYSPSSRKEDETRRVECLKGRSALTLPPAIVEAKAGTDWALTDWIALGEQVPTPELLERARQVWAAGPRSLGADSWSPIPNNRTLSKLAQWRAAHAIQLWQSDSRAEALAIWETSVQQALMASSGLMETMMSVSELSRVLMGIQMTAQSSAPIDHQEASALFKIVALADQMPDLVRNAMISEWQMVEHDLRSTYESLSPKLPEEHTRDQAIFRAAFEILRDVVFDPVDTVNHFTAYFELKRNRLGPLSNGDVPPLMEITRTCEWMGNWAIVWCRPYERNPLGRFLMGVKDPKFEESGSYETYDNYDKYGTRIADLRNLAAATRLTIEARRQGLQGKALARFVAEAPENMRDIFSRAPFAYDPSQRQLTIQLREKSTVLGEGSYTLPL